MSETTKHREVFEVFFRLGAQRTIERLREALLEKKGRAPSIRSLYDWSSKYQRQARIARLEHEARIAEDEVRIADIRRMHERHAREAVLLQEKAIDWLKTVSPNAVTLDAAIKAIVEGAKLESLSRGEPTSRQEVIGEFEARFAEISDEELEAIIEFAHEALDGASETSPG